MDTYLRIELLGGLRVFQGERQITRFRTRKTANMLAYLALYGTQSHSRESLVELFWPEHDCESGQTSLRTALASLRRQLEPPGIPTGSVLFADRSNVWLNADEVTVDTVEFTALATATTAGEPHPDVLAKTLAIYRGELLPGLNEPWAAAERERLAVLHQRFSRHFATEGASLTDAFLAKKGISRLQRSVIADLSPSPSIKSLLPTKKDAPVQPVLPSFFTRFFGREEEIEQIIARLQDSEIRLMTLTGFGGSGKTRLAREVAGRLVHDGQQTVYFISLTDVMEAEHISEAIVNGLYPRRPVSDADPIVLAARFLRGRDILLVLDNFEHLISDGGADCVRQLLEMTSGLTCLVTSRRRLDLVGEWEFPMLPLPIPKGTETPEQLQEFSCVQLFVDRAQAVRPDFQITSGNVATIGALCHRLEGIPLAVELAAARAKVLTPPRMLADLGHRFDFLISYRRDRPLRHHSLKATMDWSFHLLSPAHQQSFLELSVFRGGWTENAAAHICQTENITDKLESLRDCSLLIAMEQPDGMRFDMLSTLRDYADGQPMSDEQKITLGKRHRDYYLDFAELGSRQLTDQHQEEWLARLEREHENLRAACNWCAADDKHAAAGLRLTGALWRFWKMRGYLSEGRARLAAALTRVQDAGAFPHARATALNGAGNLAHVQGDYQVARCYFEESMKIQCNLEDKAGVAVALHNMGDVAFDLTNWVEACDLYSQSLILWQQMGGDWGVAYLQDSLGRVALASGAVEHAQILFSESLVVRQRIGDLAGTAATLINQGLACLTLKDLASGRENIREGFRLFLSLGDRCGLARSLEAWALGQQMQGKCVEASRFFKAAMALRQTVGAPLSPSERVILDRVVRDVSPLTVWGCATEKLSFTHDYGEVLTIVQATEEVMGYG